MKYYMLSRCSTYFHSDYCIPCTQDPAKTNIHCNDKSNPINLPTILKATAIANAYDKLQKVLADTLH